MSSQSLKERNRALELIEIGDSYLKLEQIDRAEENFARGFQIAQTFPDNISKSLPKGSLLTKNKHCGQLATAMLKSDNMS